MPVTFADVAKSDYILLTTMPTYFTTQLHISDTTSSLIIIGVELMMMAVLAPLGALSDRIGRKPLLITMAVGYIVLSYPAFALMQTHNLVALIIGFVIVALLLACVLAVIGSTFPAMFPTRVRYGAMAIGYNLSTSIFGGTAGLVVETLINATGNNNIPAYYLIIAGVIGLVPILLMPETAKVPMNQIKSPKVPSQAVVHSSWVGSISLTASWSLRVTTSITCFKRAFFARALRPMTTSAEFSSVK